MELVTSQKHGFVTPCKFIEKEINFVFFSLMWEMGLLIIPCYLEGNRYKRFSEKHIIHSFYLPWHRICRYTCWLKYYPKSLVDFLFWKTDLGPVARTHSFTTKLFLFLKMICTCKMDMNCLLRGQGCETMVSVSSNHSSNLLSSTSGRDSFRAGTHHLWVAS